MLLCVGCPGGRSVRPPTSANAKRARVGHRTITTGRRVIAFLNGIGGAAAGVMVVISVVSFIAGRITAEGHTGPPEIRLDARVVQPSTEESEAQPEIRTGWGGSVTTSDGETLELRIKLVANDPSDVDVDVALPPELEAVERAVLPPITDGRIELRGSTIEKNGGEMILTAVVRSDVSACPRTAFVSASASGKGGSRSSTIVGLTVFSAEACGKPVGTGDYYPGDRKLWDWNVDRVGPTDRAVLNSYINTPSYGHEPSLMMVRSETRNTSFSYSTQVAALGERLTFRVTAINSSNENVEPMLTAKATHVRVSIPTGTSQRLRVRGYVSSANADMAEATSDLVSDQPFMLRYVPGSARAFTIGGPDSGAPISDDVVSPPKVDGPTDNSGALIGSRAINGDLLPGAANMVAVEINVEVVPG